MSTVGSKPSNLSPHLFGTSSTMGSFPSVVLLTHLLTFWNSTHAIYFQILNQINIESLAKRNKSLTTPPSAPPPNRPLRISPLVACFCLAWCLKSVRSTGVNYVLPVMKSSYVTGPTCDFSSYEVHAHPL